MGARLFHAGLSLQPAVQPGVAASTQCGLADEPLFRLDADLCSAGRVLDAKDLPHGMGVVSGVWLAGILRDPVRDLVPLSSRRTDGRAPGRCDSQQTGSPCKDFLSG